jgi:site-specific DNA-methyltransferase (adenine-specific)
MDRGDVIIHGDCIKKMQKLEKESIDLILTDPPYNTGMVGDGSKARLSNMFNDSYEGDEYFNLVKGCCSELFRVLKKDRGGFLFINWKSMGVWLNELENVGFKVKNCIVWDKIVHGLNYQNYANTHEFCLFFVKGNFFPNNKTKDKEKGYWKDIWHIKRNMGNMSGEHHDTIKCDEVVRTCLFHGSNEGDLVLDCFGGSGSTAKICKQNKRNFIIIEKEEKYIKMIKDNLSQGVLI